MRNIITHAARLFAEKGYAETSIADITEATGLQRGGLYHYIDSKLDLLFAIHERAQRPLLDRILQIDEQQLHPEEHVRELARVMLEYIEEYNNEIIVFFSEWRTINDDPRWETIRNGRRKIENAFDRVLMRGQEAGAFQVKDRKLALLGFLGMLNYSHQWFNPAGRKTSREVADIFADIFMNGIAQEQTLSPERDDMAASGPQRQHS